LSAQFFRLQTCSQSGTEKGLGLLKKRFVICGKTFRALHEKNSAFLEKQMRTKKSTPSVLILSGERGKKEGVDVSKYAVCLNKLI